MNSIKEEPGMASPSALNPGIATRAALRRMWLRQAGAALLVAGLAACSGGSDDPPAPQPTPPVISQQPQSVTAAYGQTATFTVRSSSDQALSYQWRRDGLAIPGATGASYTTPMTVRYDDGATFAVTVTSAVGSTDSQSATLTLTGVPIRERPRLGAGSSHSVLIQADGTVLSWGNIKADIGTSLSGLMGVGTSAVVAGTPTLARTASGTVLSNVQTVAAGQWSTLVLKTDGTVWGWGYSGWGNLGYGPAAFEQRFPVQARLPDGTPLTSVVQLAAGLYSTSMAVTADGTVWGWGQNRYGHLGLGFASETGQPTPAAMLAPSGSGRFTDAVQAAPGVSSAAVLKRDGTVYTVGWAGPLGDGSTVNRTLPGQVETAPGIALTGVSDIAAGAHHYVALTRSGMAYAWGDNGRGQLGDGTTSSRGRAVPVRDENGNIVYGIAAVAAGSDFTVFLKSDGTVWATGNNDSGQLGTNSAAAFVTHPALIRDAAGNAFGEASSIAALDAHTLVRRKDGSVWAWGKNTYLQLGDLTAVDRRNPVRVPLPSP